MKKVLLGGFSVFLCFLFSLNVVNAKSIITATECEYTEAYKKWLKLSEEERKETLEPAMCKTSGSFFSVVGNSNVVESYTSTKFDLRKYNAVSSMKDQGNTGACWTFATMESIESNLRLNGKGNYDLSEAHLELATQNSLFTSLLPFSRTFDIGGNYFVSTAYLMGRVGPVSETSVPFNFLTDAVSKTRIPTLADISGKKVEVAVNDVAMYTSEQGVCSSDAITSIKKYLVSNGSAGASIYFNMNTQDTKIVGTTISGKFLNGQYYYYDGSAYITLDSKAVAANQSINHAVTIIGWDDTISKDNFSTKPKRDGAWLVKNSYGESYSDQYGTVDMGDKGYYYISYDDVNVCTSVAGFYNVDTEFEDNVYYYDKLGGIPYLGLNADLEYYLANVFNKTQEKSEMLEEISFYNFNLNQKYDLLYGEDLNNMRVIHSGVVDHVGVVTVDIDPINLTTESFVVGIKIYAKAGDIMPAYTKVNNTFFTMDVPKNVSYLSDDGKNWGNYGDGSKDFLLPLRVYTSDADYTFGPGIYKITPDTLNVKIEYDGINESDISFHIYDRNDINYENLLDDKFNIDNQLSNNKVINVSLNDNSTVGNYKFVSFYKNNKLIAEFDIVEEEGKLIFKEVIISNEPDEVPEFVVNDNPNNSNVETPKEEENISKSPGTGILDMAIVVIILILSFGMLMIYYFYNFKRSNEL